MVWFWHFRVRERLYVMHNYVIVKSSARWQSFIIEDSLNKGPRLPIRRLNSRVYLGSVSKSPTFTSHSDCSSSVHEQQPEHTPEYEVIGSPLLHPMSAIEGRVM
jgi:hypothetical protein